MIPSERNNDLNYIKRYATFQSHPAAFYLSFPIGRVALRSLVRNWP